MTFYTQSWLPWRRGDWNLGHEGRVRVAGRGEEGRGDFLFFRSVGLNCTKQDTVCKAVHRELPSVAENVVEGAAFLSLSGNFQIGTYGFCYKVLFLAKPFLSRGLKEVRLLSHK